MNAPIETQPALPANAQTSALILDPQAMQKQLLIEIEEMKISIIQMLQKK